jgi:hypothetical protein
MQQRMLVTHVVYAIAFLFVTAASAHAQVATGRLLEPINLSGPRMGATFLGPDFTSLLRERGIESGPVISQFGWQFEKRIRTGASGLTVLNEWVVLAGGLEQGVVLPSLSWLVGLRSGEGFEFGVGPNVTPAGVALAVAAGVTVPTGALNVPLNVAIVPSRAGVRVSILTGFNFRR